MHKIPSGDIVEIQTGEGKGDIVFFCDSLVCPSEENLAYRAARLYLDEYEKLTGKSADVSIRLSKITPTGAGLGGGSADAATVLDMLNKELYEFSDDALLQMAEALGSDVPFCLERYMSAVCTGRGEICRSIDTLPYGICLVVAKPKESINTKGIYGEYDKKFGDDYSKSKTDEMEKALSGKDLSRVAKMLVNDFESVCIPRLPEIEEIKKLMIENGAVCSQMSGSGSAVFGLFDKQNAAVGCHEALKKANLKEVYVFNDSDFQKMYKGE